MIRLIALAALLTLAAPAAAQEPPALALSLAPTAEPIPALKYLLVPELRDQKPGNAVLLYYRAFSPEWQSFRRDPQHLVQLDEVAQKPLRSLRREDFQPFAGTLGSSMLKEVDRAARRSYCDWELADRLREDGIGLLLPDLQSLREFARLLQLRAKQELLEGRYDRAAQTLQTGLAMGRQVAEGPTLIHGLVGVAIATLMLDVVENWIDSGGPNLFWALANLPHPLIDLRTCFQGERLCVDQLFPGYREQLANLDAPPSAARVQTTLQQYAGMLALDDEQARDPYHLHGLLAALRAYPRAKHFLRTQGRTAEQVEALPALQAVFLYEVHQYDVAYDQLLKVTGLPYYQAAPLARDMAARLKAESAGSGRSTLAALLVPGVDKVLAASPRIERKIAALRCVEALRLHAAAHGGRLPVSLEEVTEVPLPLDPWTGKAFAYRLDKDKAVLSGPPLAGEKPGPNNCFRYELTIRTSKGEK
jgi:hypothetical protein